MAFSIRLPKEIDARLEHLASVTGRPKAFYVNQSLILGRSLEVLEAIYLQETERESARAATLGQELGKGLNLGVNQLSLV